MRREAITVSLLVAACGSHEAVKAPRDAATVAQADAPVARPDAAAVPLEHLGSIAASERRWIAGDLHMHAAPLDSNDGQTLDATAMSRLAQERGLEFVIATPHVHPSTWETPARKRAWLKQWEQMAVEARAATGATVIPGVEYTNSTYGHFGVSGVDLAKLGDHFLADAAALGGFVVVNHPFAVPTHIPGISISNWDLSFRPWTSHRGPMPHLDGVEVMNGPLALANMVSKPNGVTGEQAAFVAADQLARTEHRHVATVGGSDSHRELMQQTTWVLATDAREPTILAALHRGATCVGSSAAGTLEAHGDRDAPDHWARIGEDVSAAAQVDLRFVGTGELFVDGVSVGEHTSTYVHTAAAGPHTYRLVLDGSRCGFIYANL